MKANKASLTVLAGCHSLVSVAGNLVGDPLEKEILEGLQFTLSSDKFQTCQGPGLLINPLKVFSFNSAIKRMSVFARVVHISERQEYWILTKGAPEVIKKLLAKVPSNFD
jgi:manganese-transporting P-type ATPase